MFQFEAFSTIDMMRCGTGLRRAAAHADTMEDAAAAMVEYLYDQFVDASTDERSCAFVRFYKTHPFADLEPDAQGYVRRHYGDHLAGTTDVRCLKLLAAAGNQAASTAMPLASVEVVEQAPMISPLARQLGLDVAAPVLLPDHPGIVMDRREGDCDVFYVPEALGSPYVAPQDDVVRLGIRSALSFGGLMPGGELFAVTIFSKTSIPRESADLFRSLALSVKLAILAFPHGQVFRATVERLLEVTEVALRESEARATAITEAALDSIVTMDADGAITGFNPAAEMTFGYRRDEVIGQQLGETLVPRSLRDQHHDGLARYLKTGEGSVLGQRIEVAGLRRDGSEFPAELTIMRVDGPGPATFVGYVRDITSAVHAQRALAASHEQVAHIARTLQASLLPPHLPPIPGLDLAARFIPAGRGIDVGGDFYDVFETGRNDWAVVIGDVCGKGPEAAAVTALARYTIRATAMAFRRPSEILPVLNEAVLRQHPERYCTAAYARLRQRGGRLRMSAACGGHPSPFLVRPGAEVRRLCEPAWPVGMFESFEVRDRHVTLEPGDTIVFYTDGVSEARGPSGELSDDEVERLVGEAAASEPTADELAETIASLALDVQDGDARDDIAVLVVRVH